MLTHELLSLKSDNMFNRRKKECFIPVFLTFFVIMWVLFFAGNAHALTREIYFDPVQDERIMGYKLHYGQSESLGTSVDLLNNTTYELPDLEEGATYYFAASAYDAYGNESGLSDILIYTVSQTDTDGDGTPDSLDNCPTDPNKTSPGVCGCGISDTDSDGDGFPDCNDGCSSDPQKTSPGVCGCGVSDTDSDGDGFADCNDGCPGDPQKTSPGVCGCGVPDTDSDGDGVADCNDGCPDDPDKTEPGDIGCGVPAKQIVEIGETFVNDKWQRVNFTGIFIEPVVVAKPAGFNDPDPAVVRIRNVDEAGFEIRIQEWDYLDGTHSYEHVSYLVIEKGSYVLPGGVMMQAGTFDADGKNFRFNPFSDPFKQTPVVIASVTSVNGKNAVVGRIRNISLNGFEYYLQEQETNRVKHTKEKISYFACEPFSGVLNHFTIEVGTTGNMVNQNFYYLPYNEPFFNIPYFLADIQTTNDIETANVRWRNKNRHGVEMKIAEEKSRDAELNHSNENVGYILLED